MNAIEAAKSLARSMKDAPWIIDPVGNKLLLNRASTGNRLDHAETGAPAWLYLDDLLSDGWTVEEDQ
jgi:hypothetical protein